MCISRTLNEVTILPANLVLVGNLEGDLINAMWLGCFHGTFEDGTSRTRELSQGLQELS